MQHIVAQVRFAAALLEPVEEPGHRWLMAQGPYAGNKASLTIYVTEGGVFDAAEPPAHNDEIGDGTMTIDCAFLAFGEPTHRKDCPPTMSLQARWKGI